MPHARVLFIFVDGLGLGPDDPATNPVAAAGLPTLTGLLGGRPLLGRPDVDAGPASLVAVDATHGVAGIPQSGTGHATILTGHDAVRRFGRHHGPWVPTALRPLVAEESILARAKGAGLRVAFANAYPEELLARLPTDRPVAEAVTSGRLGPLRAGPPLAALGAGELSRHTAALERGDAVASEITNDGWIEHLHRSLPRPTAGEAGGNLARIANRHHLTLFAHYTTDYVGHRGTFGEAVEALERLDAFLGGVLAGLADDTLVVVASDHGNIEDVTREHTLNPALGLLAGPRHREVAARIRELRDVPRAILGVLGVAAD